MQGSEVEVSCGPNLSPLLPGHLHIHHHHHRCLTLISKDIQKALARGISLPHTLKNQLTKPKWGLRAVLLNACEWCGNLEPRCVTSGKALPTLGLPFLGFIMSVGLNHLQRPFYLAYVSPSQKEKLQGTKRHGWFLSSRLQAKFR